jgi:hypothetical protein
MLVADIGEIDLNLSRDAVDIAQVAAVFGNEAVDKKYPRIPPDQLSGEIRADEPKASGDENTFAFEEPRRRRSIGHEAFNKEGDAFFQGF